MPTNLPKVPVLCIAQDQTGAPLAGGKFEARLDRLETYNGFVVPEITTGIADADGACVLNLWPNSLGTAGSTYRVRAWSAVGKRYLDGYAVVPDAPCALQDILIATSPPELDMALTAAASAAASAGAAEAAADRAEAAGGGGGVDPSGALLVANRLSEYALNPAAQTAAQANLGLGVSDPLAYYILAKA